MRITIAGWLVLLFLLLSPPGAEAKSIVQSKHNLSSSGPGTVKAATFQGICDFCHTPHNAGAYLPLWNKDIPGRIYTTYQSSTLKAAVGQPDGASKLCLSCHDGTIALGLVRSQVQPIPLVGGVTTMPRGAAHLGTDLSDDHPVSFVYDAALAAQSGQLQNPGNLPRTVRIDKSGKMQCSSCHNPHDDQYGKFLVMANSSSALCIACHEKNFWSQTTHRTSTRTWNGVAPNPWPHTSYTSVATNGCENCHRPHTAGWPQRLLNANIEENNCYPCHNGNVAQKNVQADFLKPSIHPIGSTAGVHNPAENAVPPTRHVECADCHNPHASNATPATAPIASGRLAGLAGISSSGATVNPLVYEYQLCFRCHGDSPGTSPPVVTRWIYDKNMRNRFAVTNASYHSVIAQGKNPAVPSLITPWTTSSLMYCTDCHNSDSGARAGGFGPNGAHGSNYRPLLINNETYTDNTTESAAAYALCYRCHERSSILADQSFKEHRMHIVEERTPCTVCHDSHGVATNNHLINFDKMAVFPPNGGGAVRFVDQGPRSGACYLKCHGENHNPLTYHP